MKKNSLVLLLGLAVGISAISVLAALRGLSQSAATGQEVDVSHFPIATYNSSAPSDPKEREKRIAKGKKYNSKHTPAISESTDQIFTVSDWDLRLPALPVSKSAAIIIGEVTEAGAYLSEDQTDVYSEFTINVDDVLKNDKNKPIIVGSPIVVERKGGRVRLPSGKLAVSLVNHQDMPRVGSRYVFFLTHDFPRGGEIEDFYILTGYELRAGRVFALDKIPIGHPITAYNGRIEASFLTDLQAALASASLERPNQ